MRAERNHHVVLALDNGFLMRGGIDELPHMHASFLPTAYVRQPIRYHESFSGFADGTGSRLTGPGLTMIRVEVDGAPLAFGTAQKSGSASGMEQGGPEGKI